jgi:alpha-galactosidase
VRRLRATLAGLSSACLALALAAAASVGTATPASALNNGLALTPPMGFNDWNAVHCGVNEAFIKQTADLFVSTGLKAAGYQYVNIDDCWAQSSRDSSGNLVPNFTKFPDGISGTAAYVHSRGLKLGIYGDSGTHTCSSSGFPGSLGHEMQDARTWASWGVDYLKYDDCNVPASGHNAAATMARYRAMRDALAASGRAIVFSLCEKGDFAGNPSTWSGAVGNLWRTTGDIHPDWARIKALIAQNIPDAPAAGPGAWNDPDMLEIGNGTLSVTEQQTHFSMWAEMAAPLLIGTRLAGASATTMSILLNADVIAVDQDSLGKQGRQIANSGGLRVLAKPLANGDVAVALYNETDAAGTISTTASAAGLPAASSYTLTDLWSKTARQTTGAISASVPAHGTVLYRVHPSGSGGGTDFSMSVAPTTQTVTAGSPATYTVHTSVVSGTPGPITLSASVPPPAGAAVSFSPNPVPAGSDSTMTITTAAGDPGETTAVTVTGSDDVATHTAGTTLVVTPQGGGGLTLSGLVVHDSANAAGWSLQTNLQVGNTVYGDRAYTVASLPAALRGAHWVRTANASKTATANPLASFTISQGATVYVGVDTRTTKRPWMDASWVDTHTTLTTHEGSATRTFELYSKSFAAGQVALGPDAASATTSMYTVTVV